ncbi:hypothetical protein TWF730_004210 [Orbilia blumenaviensis]|uniref:Uncharacterized protein n=1 Tax=Orbilia blumenaviensis TaxID=1796055 RepID=A0AAV9TZJ0_9PEZI
MAGSYDDDNDDDAMDLDGPDPEPENEALAESPAAASTSHTISLGTQATVKAVPFPKAVLDKLIITLEEGMDSKALDFLTQITYSGISTPPKPSTSFSKKEITIPPSNVLTVITNISLHPTYTTRRTSTSFETDDVAIKASSYLRNITRLAGATNCALQSAWGFRRYSGAAAAASLLAMMGDGISTTGRRTRIRPTTTATTTTTTTTTTAASRKKGRQKLNNSGGEIDITPFANLPLANNENMFNRADDIWSIIGWAFVCSCVHKHRWHVWRDFLELLVEVLTNDFQERIDAAVAAAEEGGEEDGEVDLQGSLITSMGFLPDLDGGAGYKRVVRAIFANGEEKSRNEWTAIFPKETKGPPRKEQTNRKWTTATTDMNTDTAGTKTTAAGGLYAGKSGNKEEEGDVLKNLGANVVKDYHKFRNNVNDSSESYKEFRDKLAANEFDDDDGDDSDDENEEEKQSTNKPLSKKKKQKDGGTSEGEEKFRLQTPAEAAEAWGGMQAIILRLKFMALLTYTFAHDIPTLDCFYTEFTDTLRLLPLPQLQLFTSTSFLPPQTQITPGENKISATNPAFHGTILTTILQKSMTFQPATATGWNEHTDSINDYTLKTWYLPHPARGSDVECQVRLTSTLESLARLWHTWNLENGGWEWSVEMEEAVEEGIRVRRERAEAALEKRRKVRKRNEVDEVMIRMLGVVEGRLRCLVRVAKVVTLRNSDGKISKYT